MKNQNTKIFTIQGQENMWFYSVINLKYKVLENYKENYPKGSQRLVEWTSQRSYIKRLGGARKKF